MNIVRWADILGMNKVRWADVLGMNIVRWADIRIGIREWVRIMQSKKSRTYSQGPFLIL